MNFVTKIGLFFKTVKNYLSGGFCRLKIRIRLISGFAIRYKFLQLRYGKKLAKLNGFDDRQLSYTDFIDNFVDKDVVADSSIDGNSNVGRKDVVTLEREMSKPHMKLLAFNKIFYELAKRFGKKVANEWLTLEWIGGLYMHDAPSSTLKSYCFAYDIKDLAEKGLYFIEGQNAEPAKHLTTFVDFLKEYISFACNRTSGAVGLPNIVPYMYFFWKRDVNNDYLGIKTTGSEEYYAKQNFQRFIYAANQVYVRDGSQSAFTNTSVFDHEYFEALFGGAVFPDGTYMMDYEEEIVEFQKWYMEVMSDIRSHSMFTFPVSTISLLRKNKKFVDEKFAKWAVKHNMKWSDSNLFVDSSVNSLSNCCFDGSQMTLSKSSNGVNFMSFKDLYESKSDDTKRNFTVYHNGSWVKGKVVRMPKRPMYKVTTANNKTILVTDNHINPTLRGDIQTSDITTNDYLMFNTNRLDSVKEVDDNLTYEQGFLVGMYIGDGSMCSENHPTHTTTVNLSLNKEKYEASEALINKAFSDIGVELKIKLGAMYNNVYPASVISNEIAAFIRRFVIGDYCFEKELNMDCLLQSYNFRRGILDGYYLTDGGNSNRIYTTSPKMVACLEALISSLGLNSIIDVTDRTDEDVVIRGNVYNRNYPLYCVRWYDFHNRRTRKDVYIRKNNSVYFKVKSIEPYETDDEYVYCFEVNDNEPYFTLPNGIITHNCRLKSSIEDLGYFNSIGGTALKVGSVKVNTVNLARIALDSKDEDDYIEKLKHRTYICLCALDAVRHIIKRNVEKGILPNFSYGLIDFEHLYNTIGFIGIYETMKKFGYITRDEFDNTYYTEDASRFGKKIFETMRKVADDFIAENKCDYQINTEQIPGESAAAKLMQKDKFFYPDAKIYDLPLYGNQFIPLGIKTTLQERVRIAAEFDKFCNGGSILHVNIDAPFDSFEKAWDMVEYIADQGVTYFAFNTKIQACEDNHAFYGDICPECHKGVATEYTRIVGFYTPIRTWSKERTEEYELRRWEPINQAKVGNE